MGLDTSHDCWHGPYSAFNRFRKKIAEVAGYGNLDDYEGFGGAKQFPEGDPLVVLLNHSDCEGSIEAKDCAPLADRMEQLLPALIAADGPLYPGSQGSYTWAAERFIKGLRLAASENEPVEFH